MKLSTKVLLALGSTLVITPFACSDISELQGQKPPSGGDGGKWDPGDGGLVSGTTTGTGIAAGSGGAGGSGPPMCDDSLKRCDHVFTYQDKGESTVEVHGDFDAWGPGMPMTKSGGTWSATVPVPYNAQVLYKFVLNGNNWVPDPANPSKVDDNMGGYNSLLAGGTCDKYTCVSLVKGYDWRDAVLYFVFVDRFVDGDPSNNGKPTPGVQTPADYQGGDWAGVTQKIKSGYFTDLGVNTLWLTVPVDNTEQSGAGQNGDNHQYSAYHGYWPKDLDNPDEHFGKLPDLKNLVAEAHKVGIKVILDYAMNHVHISAPVYAQNPGWFWPVTLNGQSCICGSAACDWDGANAKRCWFTDYLPDWNFTIPEARKYSVDNAISWVKNTGVDGFRLDAVKHIEDQWLIDLRARVTSDIETTSNQHFYMVGETFTGDTNLIKYYVNPTKMLDGQFDFPFRIALVTALLNRTAKAGGGSGSLDDFMTKNEGIYGSGVMSTFIGNHDVPRSINFAQDAAAWSDPWDGGKNNSWSNQPNLPGGTSAFERLANAFAVLFTTPGVPLIYYGDEIGLPGGGDPDNRRMMQWSGYSAGQQLLFGKVKKLTSIRAAHPSLRRGKRTSLGGDDNTLVYKMVSGPDTVYVAVNRDDAPHQVGNLPGGALMDLLNGGSVSGPSVTVPARTTLVLTP